MRGITSVNYSRGAIDAYLPGILQLTLTRLQKPFEEELQGHQATTLKNQLLMVFVATFYYGVDLLIRTMAQLTPPLAYEWLIGELLRNRDNWEGIHERKVSISNSQLAARMNNNFIALY